MANRRIYGSDIERSFVEFEVEGKEDFPFDMLRYDACWPRSQQDVARMTDRGTGTIPRTITLLSSSDPTRARWKSFGWKVA